MLNTVPGAPWLVPVWTPADAAQAMLDAAQHEPVLIAKSGRWLYRGRHRADRYSIRVADLRAESLMREYVIPIAWLILAWAIPATAVALQVVSNR
jgi:hypothetical protein